MAQKLGNARLAIPKVNRNPRITQAKRVPARRALANRAAVKTPATSTAQPTNSVPATQTTPTDPFQAASAPAAPPAPTGLFDLPAYTPQNGQDPRDATYWSNLAKLKFSSEQEYAAGLREQQRADTSYSDALQAAIRNRGVEQRTLGENAIRGNLGASGWLNRNEAEQTTAYTQERSSAQRSKEEEDQGRLAAQKAILQAFQLEGAGLLSEAGQRYAEAQAYAAQNEEPLLEPPGSPPGAAAGKGKAKIGISKAKALNPAKQAIGKRRKA